MTKEELIERINDIEWEDFEAKEAKSELPKNVWETVGAFANSSGGWIVLGVKQVGKKFEITGVDNAEKLEQDFLGTLRSQKFNEPLEAKAMLYHIDGKKVLAFHVPSSPHKPIYYNNPQNTFIRFGSGDQRATNGEISDFCKRIGICDEEGHLNYGGLMCFGRYEYVRRFVPTFWMDLVEIPGRSVQEAATRYTYRVPEQSPLFQSKKSYHRQDVSIGKHIRDNRLWL